MLTISVLTVIQASLPVLAEVAIESLPPTYLKLADTVSPFNTI